ncbi:hypothetical protein GCM10009839_21330 [Catenulispora yoronensis]|uniref:RNA polymerase sigma-70 region 2 domain-containing protein n=1 Tax=Catenulispora yoronensis TaxID=450799 RepID=A0ABP5FFP5_9ACTN
MGSPQQLVVDVEALLRMEGDLAEVATGLVGYALDDALPFTFEVFYDETFAGTKGYVASAIDDPSARDDVVQESYLTVLENWGHVRQPSAKGYLNTTARRKVIDYYREHRPRYKSRGQEVQVALQDVDSVSVEELRGGVDSPVEEIAQTGHTRTVIRTAMHQLAGTHPTQHQIVFLRYLRELNLEEIVTETGKKKNTVSSNLYMGLRNLRPIVMDLMGRAQLIPGQRPPPKPDAGVARDPRRGGGRAPTAR